LSGMLDVPEVQIECSGTASLIVALTTFKRGSARRQVVIPAYTCPLVALAVLHCGLEPVLCDLRAGHFDLDPAHLASVCSEQTLAIIATHLGGRVAELHTVLAVARHTGAHVIEDAAQALGATWQGRAVGMIGDAGFYSLAVGKGLSLYEGGVLLSRHAQMRQQFRETADQIIPHSFVREARRTLELLGYSVFYRPPLLALVYGWPLRRALRKGRLIEAVGDDFDRSIPLHRVGRWRKQIGQHALQRLSAFQLALRQQALRRIERLVAIPGLTLMHDTVDGQGVWPFLMVLMPTQATRDAALDRLWSTGLGVSRLYIHALGDYPYLATQLKHAQTPNARDFAARMLTFTNSVWLDETGFDQICRTLEQVLAGA
jgi:perosamine synthetase